MRRILRRLILVAVAFLVLVVAIAFFAGPRIAVGPIRSRIVAEISKRVQGRVSIEGLHLGWISGLGVEGVSLTRPGEREPAVAIRRISARPKIWPLVSGRVVIPDAALEGVVLRFERDAGGIHLIDLAGEGGAQERRSGEAEPRGSDEPPGRGEGKESRLPVLDVDARVRDVVVFIDDGSGAPPRRIPLIERLSLRILPEEPIRFEYAGLDGLAAKGTFVGIADRRLLAPAEMECRAKIEARGFDLARWKPFLGDALERFEGVLDLSLDAELERGEIRLGASLDGRGLRIRPAGEGAPVDLPEAHVQTELAVTAFATPRGVQVERCVVEADGAKLSATGKFRLVETGGATRPEGSLAIRIDGDGEAMTRALGDRLPIACLGAVTIEGTVAPSDVRRATADLRISGSAIALGEREGERRTLLALETVDGELQGSLDGSSLGIERCELRGGGAGVNVSGALRFGPGGGLPRGSLAFGASAALDALARALPGRLPEGVGGTVDLAGNVTVEESLTFEAVVSGLGVKVGREDLAPVNFSSRMRGTRDAATGVVTVPEVELRSDGLSGTATLLLEPGRSLRAEGTFDLELARLTRAYLAVLAPSVQAAGSGRAHLLLEAPLGAERPPAATTARVEATLDEVGIPGVAFRKADVVATIRDGAAVVERGSAIVNGGATTVTGRADWAGETPHLQGKVTGKGVGVQGDLQPLIARVIPIFAGVGAIVQASVDVDLELDARGADREALARTLAGSCRLATSDGRLTGSSLVGDLLTPLGVDPILDFQKIESTFRIADGAVIHDALVVPARQVDLKLAGTTKLDGTLDYRFAVRPKQVRNPSWNRFAKLIDKNGFLPLGLGGTIRSPAVVFPDPGELLDGALEGAVDDLLKRGLEKILRDRERDKEKDGGKKKREEPKR